MSTNKVCPKCSQALPKFLTDDTDQTPEDLARLCQYQNTCPYVPCDQINCRAKVKPVTLEEWQAAADHWRRHYYMAGCSHGR